MKKGALIFAHNTGDIDYVRLATISAKLIIKNMSVPVSLVTDQLSLDSSTADCSDFEQVIVIDAPPKNHYRHLENKTQLFLNSTRQNAWKLTPYDRTLLIDSDVLIMNNQYGNYWDVDEDFLICESMINLSSLELGTDEQRVSDKSLKLSWATAVMFTKNNYTKLIFDTVTYVRNEYRYISEIYEFPMRHFRNDIAFSVSNHIVNGFQQSENFLPPMLWASSKDQLLEVDGSMFFSVDADGVKGVVKVSGINLHIMNKTDILKFETGILAL
jgi:hypothetical protein